MALTTQQALNEAKQAYHDLLTGQAVTEFRDQNGETVRYTQINRAALADYISRLERQLATENGATPSGIAPMRVWF